MLAPVRTVAPAAPLIGLSAAKAHLRVTHDHEDMLIVEMAAAAESYLDGWSGILGRCLKPQTWRSYAAGLTDLALPFPDVQTAVVKYLDVGGTEQVLSTAAYRVGNDTSGGYLVFEPGYALPATAVREDAVRIEAVYGYAADAVPQAIVQAGLMILESLRQRDGGGGLPPAAMAILTPFRRSGP